MNTINKPEKGELKKERSEWLQQVEEWLETHACAGLCMVSAVGRRSDLAIKSPTSSYQQCHLDYLYCGLRGYIHFSST